ncbi:MAG: hypothetical protein WDM87_01535 [Terracidiphilus sp.]
MRSGQARGLRSLWSCGLGAQGFGGGPFAGGVDLGDIFGDLFGEMFTMGGAQGGGSRGSRTQRGDDLRFDLSIDFEQAVFGTEKEVKIRRLETCTVCSGKGSASGRGPSICTQCQGRGQLRYQQGFFFCCEDVRGMQRNRLGDQRPLHGVPRRRPKSR